MCGINGIIQLEGASADAEVTRAQLRAMNQAIAHRGPDGEGEYLDRGIALGHRRLSILDLSENGAQPMFNRDRTKVLVFNGEIYNYLELMAELKQRGHSFRSHSDSEVLLHAYEEWGAQCVERFNGMWAFAIWDCKHRTLFASRDRLGVKPFYYAQVDGRFLFSSEIKGIGAVLPLNDANLGKVYEYLAYGYRTNDGETFFADVSELPPAHNLFIEHGSPRFVRYWQLPAPQTSASSTTDEELRGRLDDLLKDAVRLRFRSDVPVALLQSGGLDSSAICRIVDDDIEAGRLGYKSVTAYTAVFPGYKHNEADTVRELIASCRHVQLEEIAPNGAGLVKDLPAFIRGMGEPLQSTTSFAHYSLMRAIHDRGIKVVINGQGADEIFAGYGYYITGYRLLDTLLSKPADALHQARAMHNQLGYGYKQLAGQLGKAMLGRRRASRVRAAWLERTVGTLSPDFCNRHLRRLSDNPMSLTPRNLDRHLRTQIERYGFNQILHYEDQSSMLNSIEIRSPFIDYRLMEFAFALPDRLKFDRGITKRILRETFSKQLPQRVLTQPKIGFATPFAQWMQEPHFKTLVHDLIGSDSFMRRRIWRAEKLRTRFAQPQAYPAFPFWRFINLEMWAQAYGIRNL